MDLNLIAKLLRRAPLYICHRRKNSPTQMKFKMAFHRLGVECVWLAGILPEDPTTGVKHFCRVDASNRRSVASYAVNH